MNSCFKGSQYLMKSSTISSRNSKNLLGRGIERVANQRKLEIQKTFNRTENKNRRGSLQSHARKLKWRIQHSSFKILVSRETKSDRNARYPNRITQPDQDQSMYFEHSSSVISSIWEGETTKWFPNDFKSWKVQFVL